MRAPNAEEQETLSAAIPLRQAQGTLVPVLEAQKEDAIARLLGLYRGGQLDNLLGATAEVAAHDDLLHKVKQLINRANNIEERLNDSTSTSNRSS